MPASEVPWLGARLREERLKRGISLRSLARDVGVSASMVSQIETSKSQPSVSTLYAITSALGISIEDVFAPPERARSGAAAGVAASSMAAGSAGLTGTGRVSVGPAGTSLAGTGLAGTGLAESGSLVQSPAGAGVVGGQAGTDTAGNGPTVDVVGGRRDSRRGPLVRRDDRQVLVLDSGVTWELLGELPSYPADFLRVTYPPGSTSSSNGGLMRHAGSEFGYLLSGQLILTLGFDEHRLVPGDAFSFESSTPHAYRNEGSEAAVGVWFVIEEHH